MNLRFAPALLSIGAACSSSDRPPPPSNPPPEVQSLVITGPQTARELDQVVLWADLDDSCSLGWRQLSGPAPRDWNATGLSLSFAVPPLDETSLIAVEATGQCGPGKTFVGQYEVAVEPEAVAPRVEVFTPDATVGGSQVLLRGVITDGDDNLAEAAWTQVAGPEVDIRGVTLGLALFTAPRLDEDVQLSFELRAVDRDGQTAVGAVTVQVAAAIVEPAAQVGEIVATQEPGLVRLVVEHSAITSSLTIQRLGGPGGDWAVASASQVRLSETQTVVLWDVVSEFGYRGAEDAWIRMMPYGRDGSMGDWIMYNVGPVDNRQAASQSLDNYAITYGDLSPDVIAQLQQFHLAIVHPFRAQLTRPQVEAIQRGVDPDDPSDDVIVLCYLSVGEDLRTASFTDAEALADPRFVGDGTGPRVDPRGPEASGESFEGIDRLGISSPGGTGYAPFYLDDNSVSNDPNHIGDGIPDRNPAFGAYFVNMGHPQWFITLDDMTFANSGFPGIRELVTTRYGRGLGCDGLFLDTIDTAAPNSFTDETSFVQSEFEWTAPGVRDFMQRLRRTYPDIAILQNRGLFFFNPLLPHFEYRTGDEIDFLLFESFRLDSNPAEDFNPFFFGDNRYNFGPKLVAEAARPKGFKVLSLGYTEGPGVSQDTLLSNSTVGEASLVTDIEVTHEMGFRHYLTNAIVDLVNNFVLEQADASDIDPPRWTSVYNANINLFPEPADAPDPRVGVQQAEPASGGIFVQWDVALDKNPVRYRAYVSEAPITSDADLASAAQYVLEPVVGRGYGKAPLQDSMPYGASIPVAEGTYSVVIRAEDALGNQDDNLVVQTASASPSSGANVSLTNNASEWADVPAFSDAGTGLGGDGPDYTEIQIANDDTYLYLRMTSAHPFSLGGAPGGFSRSQVFIDADNSADTGWNIAGIGSDFVLNGANLFPQSADAYTDGFRRVMDTGPADSVSVVEIRVPLELLGLAVCEAPTIRVAFFNDETLDRAPDSGAYEYGLDVTSCATPAEIRF